VADIRAGKVQTVVVYKVDRLTRSLSDFAKLIELFEARGVTFVSVTQQFNTTTSMGRLMLNVLLSFAQFEREVTGERIRDKIAAAKKKGLWMGGTPPIGYELKGKKLLVNKTQAQVVQHIFRRYTALKLPHQALHQQRGAALWRHRTLGNLKAYRIEQLQKVAIDEKNYEIFVSTLRPSSAPTEERQTMVTHFSQ
jgi:DNA invertase Pin-like site-specific DNA recombinase